MWQPYDPETRLKNLRMLASKFKVSQQINQQTHLQYASF